MFHSIQSDVYVYVHHVEIMDQLQGPSSQWVDVMKKKRAIHEEVINLVRQRASSKLADKVNMLV